MPLIAIVLILFLFLMIVLINYDDDDGPRVYLKVVLVYDDGGWITHGLS